jgi:FOG: FHA domain
MKADLPLVSYERSMNHNYMVLYQCDFFGTAKDNSRDYRVRMLLENKIQGLLPVTHRQVNGESRYYYEINSLQSLDRLIEKSEMKYRELRAVLLGCVNLFDRLEEFLLNGEQIVMKSEFIYVNVESMEPYFVCYPNYTGDVRYSFMEFVDELLAHIDHTDEQAVMLGYQVYRYTRNPNYVLGEIRKFMECTVADTAGREDCDKTGHHRENAAEFCFAAEEDAVEINSKEWNYNKLNQNGSSFVLKNQEECDVEDEGEIQHKKGSVKELVGGIFCVFVALCAGAIIVGARVLNCYKLSGDNELYMYGAVAMALVAAVLFFACYVKTVRQNKEIAELNEDREDCVYEESISRDIVNDLTIKERKQEAPCAVHYGGGVSLPYSSETVCLGSGVVEERVLRGRVNGREVNVPLGCLPLTVGKLGGVSDFIINDNAVSKMHARFEEHEGKVCVCDLNSTNGTVRNGEMIAINTPVPLEHGDTLRLGRSCFTYC